MMILWDLGLSMQWGLTKKSTAGPLACGAAGASPPTSAAELCTAGSSYPPNEWNGQYSKGASWGAQEGLRHCQHGWGTLRCSYTQNPSTSGGCAVTQHMLRSEQY